MAHEAANSLRRQLGLLERIRPPLWIQLDMLALKFLGVLSINIDLAFTSADPPPYVRFPRIGEQID